MKLRKRRSSHQKFHNRRKIERILLKKQHSMKLQNERSHHWEFHNRRK